MISNYFLENPAEITRKGTGIKWPDTRKIPICALRLQRYSLSHLPTVSPLLPQVTAGVPVVSLDYTSKFLN
jgi:hypothetical protein